MAFNRYEKVPKPNYAPHHVKQKKQKTENKTTPDKD